MSRTAERSKDFTDSGRIILLERDADTFERDILELGEKIDGLRRAILIASISTTTATIGLALNALLIGAR